MNTLYSRKQQEQMKAEHTLQVAVKIFTGVVLTLAGMILISAVYMLLLL